MCSKTKKIRFEKYAIKLLWNKQDISRGSTAWIKFTKKHQGAARVVESNEYMIAIKDGE